MNVKNGKNRNENELNEIMNIIMDVYKSILPATVINQRISMKVEI